MGLYGTGNNSYTTSGVCTYEDFLGVAARVDYATAANLNGFGAFMRAQRASNTATPVGFFNGSWAQGVTNPVDQANNPGNGTTNATTGYLGFTSVPVRNVPDNDLGWEINAGFDWKLLEYLTWKCLFAYWQPGKWFNWAYLDLTHSTSPRVNHQDVGILFGQTNPDRAIDPLVAVQRSFLFTF